MNRGRPSELIAGQLVVGGMVAGLGVIALSGLTRLQATGVVVAIAISWWYGWPWYVRRRDHRPALLRSLAAASSDGFEETIVDVFRHRGYEDVHRSQGHPGDVRCHDRAGRPVLIRALRLSPVDASDPET